MGLPAPCTAAFDPTAARPSRISAASGRSRMTTCIRDAYTLGRCKVQGARFNGRHYLGPCTLHLERCTSLYPNIFPNPIRFVPVQDDTSADVSRITGDAHPEGAGMADELERLYQTTYNAVVRFLYRKVWDADRAEDLAQEVFIRALAHRPEKPRAWVFAVAANLARDEARAAIRRKKHLSLLSSDPVPLSTPAPSAEE